MEEYKVYGHVQKTAWNPDDDWKLKAEILNWLYELLII